LVTHAGPSVSGGSVVLLVPDVPSLVSGSLVESGPVEVPSPVVVEVALVPVTPLVSVVPVVPVVPLVGASVVGAVVSVAVVLETEVAPVEASPLLPVASVSAVLLPQAAVSMIRRHPRTGRRRRIAFMPSWTPDPR
jgi:hypothetical protein